MRSRGIATPANGTADESRDDDEHREEHHALKAAYLCRDLLPIRSKESAGNDITTAPGDRRNNDGRYEDLWPDG